MTQEQQQQQQPRSAWEEAEAEGMDMSLVDCNLEKSVWERLVTHDRALSFALQLRAAMKRRQADVAT
jgi:hypothetical protein